MAYSRTQLFDEGRRCDISDDESVATRTSQVSHSCHSKTVGLVVTGIGDLTWLGVGVDPSVKLKVATTTGP